MKNKLTYEEVEKMIPDYVLGNLDNNLVELFESSILDYPELNNEVESVRNTFKKFEEFNLKESLRYESKNISVKVQSKLSNIRKESPFLTYIPKYIYPSLGFLFIVYIMFFTDSFDNKKELKDGKFTILTDADYLILENENQEFMEDFVESSYGYEFVELYENEIIEYELLNDVESSQFEDNYNSYNRISIEDMLSGLEENDFINILKEMKNEKIGV